MKNFTSLQKGGTLEPSQEMLANLSWTLFAKASKFAAHTLSKSKCRTWRPLKKDGKLWMSCSHTSCLKHCRATLQFGSKCGMWSTFKVFGPKPLRKEMIESEGTLAPLSKGGSPRHFHVLSMEMVSSFRQEIPWCVGHLEIHCMTKGLWCPTSCVQPSPRAAPLTKPGTQCGRSWSGHLKPLPKGNIQWLPQMVSLWKKVPLFGKKVANLCHHRATDWLCGISVVTTSFSATHWN